MKNLILSVAVITYNQEKYITQALDSILEQEHNYSYEIVIGDDCSTDETRDILLKYKEKYPSIIKLLLNDSNVGLIKNYFNTLSHCSGNYIMQCAGDDFWLPGKICYQISFMESNPNVGMCYGKIQYLYDSENRLGEIAGSNTTTLSELLVKNDISAQTVCMRNIYIKKYIEEIDPLSKGWYCEDYPLWLWISYKSKIHFMDDLFAVYRLRQKSTSRPSDYEKIISMYENIISIRKYFLKYSDKKLFVNDLISIIESLIWNKNIIPTKREYNFITKILFDNFEYIKYPLYKILTYKNYFVFCVVFYIKKIVGIIVNYFSVYFIIDI